jgi:hypothetical protein
MSRLRVLVFLAGIMATVPALAQSPMSPIFPTGTARPHRPAVKEISPAPDQPTKTPSHAERTPAEEPPVATAVVPPPVVKSPPESAEPKKPATAEAKPEVTPEPRQGVKHHKRTARHTRYARRLYMPYSARRYFETSAGTRGWGGGQFGPSPYSSNGQ